MRGQTQVVGDHHKTGSPQILRLDHIPEAVADVIAAIGQARHTARHHGIGTTTFDGGQVGARVFIQILWQGDAAKQAAALQVSLHDGGNGLRGLGLLTESGQCQRDLLQPDARHIDPELSMGE